MSPVRIAMIGVGQLCQRVHLPSLASLDGVELSAICDLDPALLAELGERYGVERRYTDYRQMVEDVAPDGVFAVGQPHLMYDVWVWCLSQGLNLFIEKPMGLSRHQAQILAFLADKHKAVTQVGHQRRSCPLLVQMRDRCTERGPITHASAEFYKCDLRPFTSARDHMLDDCVHAVDTLRWMCGGEVERLDSHVKRIGVPDINWIGTLLHFDNGSSGVLVNSWSSGRRVFRVQMHGVGICCDADPEGQAYLYADNGVPEVFDTTEVAGSDEFHVYGGFREKTFEFVESLRSGTDLTTSPFHDAVKTMDVAEKILARATLDGQ